MKTIAVVLVAVIFGAVNAKESISVEQNQDENNVTENNVTDNNIKESSGFNGSILLDLQSLIAKLRTQINKTNDDRKNNGSHEHSRHANTEIEKDPEIDLNKTIINATETNNGINRVLNTKGIKILKQLRRILEDKLTPDTQNSEKENDYEDNDGHIDDQQLNDFNRDGISHNGQGYGATLSVKGRSGFVPNDHLHYQPSIRRVIYHNPGYYQHSTPSHNIQNFNHDQIKPMNMLNNLLLQQEQQGRAEGTSEQDAKEILDDSNSYRYEPEVNEIETYINPWGYLGIS